MKLYAVFLGPVGLGVISQFSTFVGLITSTVHVGTPFSLSALLPSLYKKGDLDSKQKIFTYFKFFGGIFSVVTLIVTVIIILFSNALSNILLDNVKHRIILIIISISIPFTVLYSIFEAFLRSSEQIGRIVRVSIFTSIISLPALFILIEKLNINGVAIYLALIGVLPFVFMLTLFGKVFNKDYRLYRKVLVKQDKVNVIKTGTTSLLAFLFYQLVILYLRKFIILNFGLDANGIYQSVLGFSATIFALVFSFLGNHTLPQLSMQENNENLVSVLDSTTQFLIIIVVPILLLVYNFREIIIVVFYSKSFYPAINLILFQQIGDICRIFAALFSLWLVSRIKVKQLIVIDLTFNFLLLAFPNIFLKVITNDLRILPFSYMLASLIQFLLFYLYTKKALKFKFCGKTVKMIILSLIILIASITVSIFYINLGYFTSWFFLAVWVYIIMRYIEKVSPKTVIEKIFKK